MSAERERQGVGESRPIGEVGARGAPVRPFVTITPRPMWQLRLQAELPRLLLYAVAIWGLIASARFALDPPRPASPLPPQQPRADRAAEALAVSFARAYLTWNGAEAQSYSEALAPYFGENPLESAGIQLPASGRQEVLWAQVFQERQGPGEERIYTIGCLVGGRGMRYLSVPVTRVPGGALALAGYPALVGAPQLSGFDDLAEAFAKVSQPALQTVVVRALRNFLDGAESELAADLLPGAHVALPPDHLRLLSLQQLRWLPAGGSVFAQVLALGETGARYTLEYELDVEEVAGRWEISAIQVNPLEG